MPVNPVRDQFVNAGEIRLHCIQWGDHGTPIVCVHGLTANAFCFQALADELVVNVLPGEQVWPSNVSTCPPM